MSAPGRPDGGRGPAAPSAVARVADWLSPDLKRLVALIFVAFVDMVGLMMVNPLMPFYALRFHAAEWMVGPLISAFAVAQLVSAPYWGKVSDRVGRRPALLVGLGASGLAYIVFGFSTTLWMLFASRIVQGLGGGTTGVVQAYVADTMAPAERAKALGWISAATSAGVIIGPSLGSLTSNWGSAAPGLFAAGLVALNLAFAWRWLPESRTPERAAAVAAGARPSVLARTQRPVWHAVWEVARHPARPVHRAIWIYCVAMLAMNAQIGVLALYLKDTFAITEHNVGYIFLVFGVVGVLMRTAPVGWINARVGEVRTMRLGALTMLVGLALMPLPASLMSFLPCLVLVPVGTALLFPATTALVSHRSDPAEFGLMMGAQQTFRGLMSIIGPIGGTIVYQAAGHWVPYELSAGVLVVAVWLAFREPHARAVPATL